MITFRQYLYLIEDRIEYLTNRYKDINARHDTYAAYKKSEDIIKFWINVDPTPNKKYLDWLLRQYSRQDYRQEDVQRVYDALNGFEKYKQRIPQKDILRYEHLSDLEDAIDKVKGLKREEIKNTAHEGAVKIFDKGGVTIYHEKTVAAARFYGEGTRWCTKSKDMFEYYNKKGPLYVVFAKDHDGNLKKYQFHFESGQFMNVSDNQIEIKTLVRNNPSLQDVPEFQGMRVIFTRDFEKYFGSLLINDGKNASKDPRVTQALITTTLNHPNPKVRAKILKYFKVTPKQLEIALNDEHRVVKNAAIRDRNANIDQISLALEHPSVQFRTAALKNPNITAEHITKALDDPSVAVRRAAMSAQRRKVTAEHITKALKDSDLQVKAYAIASDRFTSEHILKALDDDDPKAREYVLRYHKGRIITPAVIDKALKDPDPNIRKHIASNDNLTPEQLERVLLDDDTGVRRYAVWNKNITHNQISRAQNDHDADVRLTVASNSNATQEQIEKAANDHDPYVREYILGYADRLLPRVIDKALDDPNSAVRVSVARRSDLSEKQVEKALKDKEEMVRRMAISNNNVSAEILRDVAQNDPSERTRREAENKLRWRGAWQ